MPGRCSYCKRSEGEGHAPGCKRNRKTKRPGPCAECGMIRHPAASTCSLRKQNGKPPTRGSTRTAKTARRAAPAAPAPAPADLQTNGVRQTARTLLAQLEALRAKLDARIAAVRELAEIL